MSPARGTRAIIPVAGVGSRLRPHTHTMPKALIHVAGRPILEIRAETSLPSTAGGRKSLLG